MALQRQVQAAKQQAQLGVLEIQLKYALAAGKTDAVAALESVIDHFKNPVVPKVQVERGADEGGSHSH